MDRNDPFEILRGNNPVDPSTIDAFGPAADDLLDSIIAEPARRQPILTRRSLYLGIAAAAILAATAATWFLSTRSIETLSVVCFESVDLDGHRSGLSETVTPQPEACQAPFQDGRLTFDTSRPGYVPPLTGCVSDNGSLYVLPTDNQDICTALGLAKPDPTQPPASLDDIGAAKEAITEYILSAECRPLEDTVTQVRRILDDNNLSEWQIQQNPGRPGQPCASIAYDIPNTTIIVVPIEPAP
jgi:hypothetical protein